MTKADALAPIIALEATVVGGRTYQAYRRGGWDEARERAIEESTGSVVWLFGVGVLSKLGDKILQKVIKNKNVNFDVGKDKLRTPFDNFVKKASNNPRRLSQTTIAMLKGAKILSSIIIANLFIGFAVPNINHALTNSIRGRKKAHEQNKALAHHNTGSNVKAANVNGENPAFKGNPINALNTFTNVIENTNVGKLLSTDIGIAGGRMYNARTKEERREIGFRDISSIYFYMWAQGHVGNLLNYIQSGRFTRLNPTTTGIVDEHLQGFIEKNGGEMSVEEFKKAGVPVVTPAGGLGCHLDATRFIPQVPQTQYPAGALACAAYIAGGIRGMERGTISEEREPDGSERMAAVELLRLAVPRRVYTLSQVKYAIDRIIWLYQNRDLIGGLKFVEEPKVLRFFFGRLEPIGDWQQKLAEKFRKDFGDSL